MPPTSAWWAREAAQPTSSPSTWIGDTSVMSGRCEPPRNGSLSTHTSPARDVALAHRGHGGGQRAQVHGDVLGLDDQPPVGVEQRGRAVAPLLDVGRQRAVDERRAHLLRDPAKRPDRDLELGGIHDLEPQHPVLVGLAGPAGRHQAGGLGELDDRRAGDRGAGREPAAGEHLGLDLVALPADRAAAALDVAGGGDGNRRARRDRGGAQRDELDRPLAVGVAVAALVLGVEGVLELRGVLERHQQLERLAGVAQVGGSAHPLAVAGGRQLGDRARRGRRPRPAA